MFFEDLTHISALAKLIRLALKCSSYKHFETEVTSHTKFYLRTPGLRKWSKETLETFYNLKSKMLELEKVNT